MPKQSVEKLSASQRLPRRRAMPLLDGFAEAMVARGYSCGATGLHVSVAAHLVIWTERRGAAIADLDEGLLARFMRHLPACRCGGWKRGTHLRAHFRAVGFLKYLRETGVVRTRVPEQSRSLLVTQYVSWMRDRRGLASATIANRLRLVSALVDAVGEDLGGLDASGVRKFVHNYIQQHAPASASLVTTRVRSFLRWLVLQGRCSTDLVEAVPKIPTWQLATLPRYLPDADVERIIAVCDRPSSVARRDRAMLLLLARLGLRAGDVVGLRFGDIEWDSGRLRVVGKGRRETRLPLPQDVGDAILEYLKAERPAAATDHVFLTAEAPIEPLRSQGLRSVVRRRIESAGVRTSSHGAHVLRHSLATRMLREGSSLDTIGAVLRHRDLNTTAIYAKVDVGLLRQVAQPWPGTEGAPC
jgi:integrase/recombinase XerD